VCQKFKTQKNAINNREDFGRTSLNLGVNQSIMLFKGFNHFPQCSATWLKALEKFYSMWVRGNLSTVLKFLMSAGTIPAAFGALLKSLRNMLTNSNIVSLEGCLWLYNYPGAVCLGILFRAVWENLRFSNLFSVCVLKTANAFLLLILYCLFLKLSY
jgi:hypothetical protein